MRLMPLLLSVGLLAACTGSGGTSSTSPVTIDASPPTSSVSVAPVAPSPASCPKDLGQRLRANDVAGAAREIVPGNPRVLVLCGPGARVVVTDERVHAIADALNHLKRVPPGAVYACPIDLGPTYGLFFDYTNGDVLLVTVEASGCRFASNGRSSAMTDGAVQASIRALLRSG